MLLFLTGFFSGAVFSTFLGTFADTFGRKRACMVCGVLGALAALSTLSSSVVVMFVGRLLGGAATSVGSVPVGVADRLAAAVLCVRVVGGGAGRSGWGV